MAVESVNINKAEAKNKHTLAVVKNNVESMPHTAYFCENNPEGVHFLFFIKKQQQNC